MRRLAALVASFCMIGCSSPPPAETHDQDTMKLFVSIAPVGTALKVTTSFASGPANTLEEIDRDSASRLLMTPSVIANRDVPARALVAEGDCGWRKTISLDERGQIHEDLRIEDGYVSEVTWSPADETSVKLNVRGYVVSEGKVKYDGTHDLVLRFDETRVLPLSQAHP
jgi:hypothetical protein